ncbi:unnamed protein product, partial [marine sediment metagenome]
GCVVEKVDKIEPSLVAPPTQISSKAMYSPSQVLDMVSIDSIRSLSAIPLYGQGYNIAVLDSGIRETHETVRGKVIYSQNFSDDPMEDKFDHGTGIASVLAATVPLSGILNMKVFNDKGYGSTESVVDAIEECITMHEQLPHIAPSVINLSIGAQDVGNPSDVLRVACREAVRRGIWVVAAAGNSGPEPGTIITPACDELVIAVGSLNPGSLYVSDFSSRGPTEEGIVKPDFVMFGENLSVASSEGDEASTAGSGTSFAVPFMSGLCILCYDAMESRRILGNNNHADGLEEVEDIIEKYFPRFCMKLEGSPAGKDNDYGYGVPTGTYVAQALRSDGNGNRAAAVPVLPAALGGILSVSILGIMARMIKV